MKLLCCSNTFAGSYKQLLKTLVTTQQKMLTIKLCVFKCHLILLHFYVVGKIDLLVSQHHAFNTCSKQDHAGDV